MKMLKILLPEEANKVRQLCFLTKTPRGKKQFMNQL